MQYSKYRFTLDLHKTRSQVSIPVLRGDTNIRFLISLTDGGKAYRIEEGCTAHFLGKKPDGTTIFKSCIIEDDYQTVRYDFSDQTTVAVGIVNCEIRIYDATGRLLTTPRFIIVVDDKVIWDEYELVETVSAHDTDPYSVAIATEQARADAETNRVAAEVERVEAEADRATAEEERKALYQELKEAKESGDFDGEDGKTPMLRVSPETNYWEVSYDNGATWKPTGAKATGEVTHEWDGTTLKVTSASGTSEADLEGPQGKSAYAVAKDNGFEGTAAEWLESLKVGKLLSPLTNEDGAFILEVGKRYKIYRTEGTGIIVGLNCTWAGAGRYLSTDLIDHAPSYDPTYDEHEPIDLNVTYCGYVNETDVVANFVLNGERLSDIISQSYSASSTTINSVTITVSGATACYLMTDEATLVAEDGASAYDIAVKKGFEGTEEEWLESLKGGINFTTDETLNLNEEGILSVNTADTPEADNTLPITARAVYKELGNIEALLNTI